MKTINKSNYKIKTVNNISTVKFTECAVLSDNIELVDDTDPDNPIDNYPEKYRKGLKLEGKHYHNDNLSYNICIDIELMNEQEKADYEAVILEQKRIDSFRGYKIKIQIDFNLITSGSVLETLANDIIKDEAILHKTHYVPQIDEDNYVIGVDKYKTIYLNFIFEDDLLVLEDVISQGEDVEINTLNNDDIRTVILNNNDNTVYKYIMPNKTV